MSQQSKSIPAVDHPAAPLNTETIKTINELVEKLQAITLTLTAPKRETPPEPLKKEPDVIRCYRVPGFIVEDERKALKEHRAKNLLDLLEKTHEDFHTIAFILQSFTDYQKVHGFTLQQIGRHLEYPIRKLARLCSILGDYQPQTAETAPKG